MNQSNEYHDYLIKAFQSDVDARYAYAEDFLNTVIATQVYVLREQRGMTQAELAAAIGTKQSGISRLENINHARWNTQTLKRIARALGVRLRITFETFGTLLDEDENFGREALQRPSFEDDPAFQSSRNAIEAKTLKKRSHHYLYLVETTDSAGLKAGGANTLDHREIKEPEGTPTQPLRPIASSSYENRKVS